MMGSERTMHVSRHSIFEKDEFPAKKWINTVMLNEQEIVDGPGGSFQKKMYSVKKNTTAHPVSAIQ